MHKKNIILSRNPDIGKGDMFFPSSLLSFFFFNPRTSSTYAL